MGPILLTFKLTSTTVGGPVERKSTFLNMTKLLETNAIIKKVLNVPRISMIDCTC